MKKNIILIMITILFLFQLSGCDKKNDVDNKTDPSDNISSGDALEEMIFKAEVIKEGDTLLVTPDMDSNEYKSSDKISVSLLAVKILNENDEEIDKADLTAGDIINITYNGVIAESYPAQISASGIQVIGHNTLLEGYLAIIDDSYQEDNGLNSEITMIALDTTEWVGLTEIEKEIIFNKMNEKYDLDIIEGTFDELAVEGLIDKDNLLFPDGIHITISNIKYNNEADKITYAIKKWRSGNGAIGANDVTAKFNGTEWTITKKDMWIS